MSWWYLACSKECVSPAILPPLFWTLFRVNYCLGPSKMLFREPALPEFALHRAGCCTTQNTLADKCRMTVDSLWFKVLLSCLHSDIRTSEYHWVWFSSILAVSCQHHCFSSKLGTIWMILYLVLNWLSSFILLMLVTKIHYM